MELDDDDPPPQSNAVGNSWNEFEAKVLPAVADDLSPAALGLSQLSFYFGALTMLNIVQGVLEGAEGQDSMEVAMDGLRDEVEGFIEGSGEPLN